MTTDPKLTKTEREELPARIEAAILTVCSGMAAMRIPANPRDVDLVLADCAKALADLDAAEAERDEIKTALGVMGATRERALEVAGSQDELEERIDSMSRERDVALKGWSAAEAARDAAAAQRDRAESERDTAIADRIIADSDAWVALGKPGGTHDTTCVQRLCEQFAEVKGERDALKARLGNIECLHCGDIDPDVSHWEQCKKHPARATVDALKAKLADPRRVLIHETEVVATKEEIATLKARLADLSDADEELHTCRALVNATSENLSVDLERMVDDLAEANEKAARSEKDSHSWHELYKDTKAKLAAAESAHSELFLSGQVAALKAKLAALVEATTSAETILGNMAKETGSRVFGRWEINHEPLRNDAQRMLPSFRAAIAAARGGAQ